MRRSNIFLSVVALQALLGGLCIAHASFRAHEERAPLRERQALVRELGLTDLCLLPEARYTRHLSQADLHSAFQDAPRSLEHFPAGSLTRPPAHLLRQFADNGQGSRSFPQKERTP